jgi:hypothetical protein
MQISIRKMEKHYCVNNLTYITNSWVCVYKKIPIYIACIKLGATSVGEKLTSV